MGIEGFTHSKVSNWLAVAAGIVLYALALNLFFVGNNIAAGGLSGIAVVLAPHIGISIGLLVYLMNIPILIAAWLMNGWRYVIGTLIAATAYSAAVDLLSGLPTLTNDSLAAAVFGGVLNGIGMALITHGNGSTGGTDLLSRLLVKKFPAMSVGKMSAYLDGAVVILAMVSFGAIEVGLYAIAAIAACSIVADRIVMGFDRGCMCMIITAEEASTLANPLMESMGRAVTRLSGTGMYLGLDRNILLLAVRPQEAPKVKAMLEKLDPKAFVILLPANELIGGHFRSGAIHGRRP